MARSPFRPRRIATAAPASALEPTGDRPSSRHRLGRVVSLRPTPEPILLDEVYEREHLGLFRFIKGVVREQELAEDILQESFLRLVSEIRRRVPPDNIHAWLYRVATNLAISRGRRAQTVIRHLPELAIRRHAASPEQHVLRTERDEALRQALDALPVEARAAVVLASSGFTAREIGAVLGKSEGAVRMLVSRGRVRVREHVSTADVERSTEAS